MTANSTSLDRINDLKSQIARLEAQALNELKAKRESLIAELGRVNDQIVEIGGGIIFGAKRTGEKAPGKSIPLQELKALLEAAPEKTLNIRKEKLDLRILQVLAEANPKLLQLGGKGAWPTVTLLK